VYGIGCLPFIDFAVDRVLTMKRRDASKGLILIAASLEQAGAFARIPDGELGERVRGDWPGPVTWILEARPEVPRTITGGRSTVAVRVTAHPIAHALCEVAGCALVSTSANVSGHTPIRDKTRLRRQLGRALDMIVPGEPGGRDKPTAIRDGSTGALIRAD
jgi:L-threonylcarbamoyladenylate synthase